MPLGAGIFPLFKYSGTHEKYSGGVVYIPSPREMKGSEAEEKVIRAASSPHARAS